MIQNLKLIVPSMTKNTYVTLSLLAMRFVTADNLCKQFGPRSGPTERQTWSGSKLFDTDIVPEKVIFEKKVSRW